MERRSVGYTQDMISLAFISRVHDGNFNFCTDDIQMFLHMKPDETSKLTGLQTCLHDIKTRMTAEMTEIVVFGPGHFRIRLPGSLVTLDGINETSWTSMRNLGTQTCTLNLSDAGKTGLR